MPHTPPPHVPDDVASIDGASQHGSRPRPLPLFLHMLRSEAGDDPARVAAVLAGVRRYQEAARQGRERRAQVLATEGRTRLLGYGGEGPPVVFVPSLINGSEILDLDAERSLMRWLASQGIRPLLVDWGVPTAAEAGMDIAGHAERLLAPLLATLPEPPILAGYCLGGTIAAAAAQVRPVRALALIATPWDHAGFPDASRQGLLELWQRAEAPAFATGLLPMDVLQAAFWRLDPTQTLAKYAAFGRRGGEAAERAFVPVEDWANGGPPMTYAAARELIEDFFGENRTATGRWKVGGEIVDPQRLPMPTFEIVSTTDRIVPAAAAVGVERQLRLALGHVGMIVGGRAKASVWEPLAAWLRSV